MSKKNCIIYIIISILISGILGFIIGFKLITHEPQYIAENTITNNNKEDSTKDNGSKNSKSEKLILEDADIRNVKWGMSKNEVMKYEGIKKSDIIDEDDEGIAVDGNIIGKNATIYYEFYNNKLFGILYMIDSPNTVYYQSLINQLEAKYGEGEDLDYIDDVNYLSTNANKKSLSEMFDTYLSLGYIVLLHERNKSGTTATITYSNGDFFGYSYGTYIIFEIINDELNTEKENDTPKIDEF